jgi:hypothetical protein
MLPAQRAKFILKRNRAMMLLLRSDVGANLLHIRLAHGKRTISTLPEKIAIINNFLFDYKKFTWLFVIFFFYLLYFLSKKNNYFLATKTIWFVLSNQK